MEHKAKKYKLYSKTICLIILTALLTGCWGARETNEVALVLAVGVDKVTNDQIEVTVAFANTLAFAAGSGGGGGGGGQVEPFVVTSVRGPSMLDCFKLLNSYIAREINLMHAKSFIFGEELARDGLEEHIRMLSRFREVRGNTYLYVCRGKAKDFLVNNKPKLETSPAKQFDLIERSSRFFGLFPRTDIDDFYFTLKSLHSSPVVSLVGINKKAGGQPQQDQQQGKQGGSNKEGGQQPEQQMNEVKQSVENPLRVPYYAGEVPRTGENKAEFLGSAVFRNDQMVGQLTGDETRTMLLLRGDFDTGIFILPDPKHEDKVVSLRLKQAKKPQIKVSIEQGQVKIKETIFLEGEFLSIPSGENYESPENKRFLEQNFDREMEKLVTELIAKTREQDWGDIFRYDRFYRKELSSWKEWESLNWKDIYDQADITVTCKSNIRRPGLLRKTEPYPEE